MSQIHVGYVLASKCPSSLAEFYSFAIGEEILSGVNDEHFCVFHPAGLKLQIYRPSRKHTFPIRGKASALCIWRETCDNPLEVLVEWASSLVSKGGNIVEEPRMESFGAEAWMEDPEGNYFLICIPTSKWSSL